MQPDTLIPGVADPQSWNRYSYVENRPILLNDPSGHDSVCGYSYSDPECADLPATTTPPVDPPDDNGNNNGNGGPQGDPEEELQVKTEQEKALEQMQYCLAHLHAPECAIPGETTFPQTSTSEGLGDFFPVLDFSVEVLDLLDLLEDGLLYGIPVYRQVKYAIPMGGFEVGVDVLLQLYDDRNLNLTITDRIIRAAIRGTETAVIDGVSIGMGTLTAAAVQASVPIPGVSAGAGYVFGSYTTSSILDNLVVQHNSKMFDWLSFGEP